jgi:hypothetical protein
MAMSTCIPPPAAKQQQQQQQNVTVRANQSELTCSSDGAMLLYCVCVVASLWRVYWLHVPGCCVTLQLVHKCTDHTHYLSPLHTLHWLHAVVQGYLHKQCYPTPRTPSETQRHRLHPYLQQYIPYTVLITDVQRHKADQAVLIKQRRNRRIQPPEARTRAG